MIQPHEKSSLCDRIEMFLSEQKGENVTRLFLGARSALSDYFVLVSCQNERHTMAVAEKLNRFLKDEGSASCLRANGQPSWVIVDAESVMIHLFVPEMRAHYDLEGLWCNKLTLCQ